MSTIRCTGTSAEAARVLIEGSALGDAIRNFGGTIQHGPGVTEVTLHGARIAMLSTGERLLWEALDALCGPGRGVPVYMCASVLDEANARALADAVSIALGAGVRA